MRSNHHTGNPYRFAARLIIWTPIGLGLTLWAIFKLARWIALQHKAAKLRTAGKAGARLAIERAKRAADFKAKFPDQYKAAGWVVKQRIHARKA